MENGHLDMARNLPPDHYCIYRVWEVLDDDRIFTSPYPYHHCRISAHHGIYHDSAFAKVTGRLVEEVSPKKIVREFKRFNFSRNCFCPSWNMSAKSSFYFPTSPKVLLVGGSEKWIQVHYRINFWSKVNMSKII
jgi:hypothetical protein